MNDRNVAPNLLIIEAELPTTLLNITLKKEGRRIKNSNKNKNKNNNNNNNNKKTKQKRKN